MFCDELYARHPLPGAIAEASSLLISADMALSTCPVVKGSLRNTGENGAVLGEGRECAGRIWDQLRTEH